jgi:hypothetical protein
MKITLLSIFLFICIFYVKADKKLDSLKVKKDTTKAGKDTSNTKAKITDNTPVILGVLTQNPDELAAKRNGEAYAGDVIRIKIAHPQSFLESKPQDKSKLLLFIDGIPFNGVYSSYFEQYSKLDIKNKTYKLQDTVTIPFVLVRNVDAKPTWDYLYHKSDFFDRKITVEVSIGWEGMFPLTLAPGADYRINIDFFHELELEVSLIFYLAFIGFFVYKASTTDMLRENSNPATPDEKGPFSLAQTQLAFWTVLAVGGFFYTLILTDIANSLNTSILLLLGITVSTSAVASYIDYYKKMTSTITAKVKSNFLKDILSDGNTYSVQRVQTAVWNLVIGLYFIYYTIVNKSMPVIPYTLLYLTGISAAAYVANKRTENIMTPTTDH